MTRKEIAAVLEEIAVLLELSGENPFKSRSYSNVARQILQSGDDINQLVKEKRLRELKGVGDALEQKITELVTTGQLQYHQELRAKFPETLFDLFQIPGLGARRIKLLHDELGIATLGELEYACEENRLASLKGFGPKMQQNVLDGLAFAKRHQGQHLVSAGWEAANALLDWLREQTPVSRLEVAGSLRRRKEIVKDIDLLAAGGAPEQIMAGFVGAPGVETVTGHGETKSSVVLASGIAVDLRVVSEAQFPYALAHFTGSKEHNVVMRQRAKDRKMKLNEYGLFAGEERLVPCGDEAAIFAALGLPNIPPELREDRGEFDADTMPALIQRPDLLGVMHCHSTYSDGRSSVEEMTSGAKARGYRYIGFADHSQSAVYAGGLAPDDVKRQHGEMDRVMEKIEGIRILKGIESDILADGSLDYDEKTLKRFDFVIASVHSKLTMTEREATQRLLAAIRNPHTTILGHPTGRLLLSREGYPLDLDAIFDACAEYRVAIEINANPHRLDLDWRHLRKASERGVKLCIGPDAHSVDGLDDVEYGLGIARKGWLTKDHLLNCMEAEELLSWRQTR
ncbi:MAG TPA: DNA polymerase/3'-5' exonuclease PolX [Candidatus Hydrogenedentes bacterium]|jgi:DNA polymerase (family 10)|nr:DNA polymerase/3'-5' exonuclease PolX [Candidatus Hydrogenedentota bacterium]HPJ97967.1 DNA polymerase/3'-5' exonuclease PolX [Candidatus Hydrogenedentota bacterium]